MLDLGADSASLASWYYQPFQNNCRAGGALLEYVHDVDFSPDGSYFVVAATGYIPNSGGLFRDVCDAAARFETNIASPTRPTWINYTGGDTLHAVVVTGGAVYIQGHQRWVDNPYGNDFAGPGRQEPRGDRRAEQHHRCSPRLEPGQDQRCRRSGVPGDVQRACG